MAENFLAVNYVRYEKDDSKSARFLTTPNPISPPNPLLLNGYSASGGFLRNLLGGCESGCKEPQK